MPDNPAKLTAVRSLSHNNAVYSVAFSTDGKRLATASLDNSVKLWDVADGRHAGTLKGHGDGLAFVDFLKDGRIATASLDKTLKLWSAEGELKTTFAAHQDYLACAALSPTGALLASGGHDKTVRLWSIESGGAAGVLTGHENTVQAVAFSRDGKLLASGGDDNTIRLWNVESKALRQSLTGHAAAVEGLAFAPQGNSLYSVSADGSLRAWKPTADGASYESDGTIKTVSTRLKTLAMAPDGRTVAFGGRDGIIRIASVAERHELAAVSAHKNTIYGLAYSPDGKLLASASFDRTIRVWQVE